MKRTVLVALSLLSLLGTVSAYAVTNLSSGGAYQLNHNTGKVGSDTSIGSVLYSAQQFGTYGQYKFSRDGGAIGTVNLKDQNGVTVKLPANAWISKCFIGVKTAPTSALSQGVISFGIQSEGILKAGAFATGYSADTLVACIQDGTTSNASRLTGTGTLQMAISSEALTAGQIDVWIQYMLGS